MNLVSAFLPPWVKPALAAGALIAAAAGGWTVNGWRLERTAAEKRAEDSRRTAQAERNERQREATWNASQQEITRVAALAKARISDDRRAADAAHQRLLDDARAAAARAAGPDPAAEPTCAPARAALAVCTDVLGRADEAAGELAAALDQSRIAGAACERSYDSLTEPPRIAREGGRLDE